MRRRASRPSRARQGATAARRVPPQRDGRGVGRSARRSHCGTWAAQLPERANIRTAIRWAGAARDAVLFADLVNRAADMWDPARGPRDELDAWPRQMASTTPTPTGGRVVDALLRRAYLADHTCDAHAASQLSADAERHSATSDAHRRAWVAMYLCFLAYQIGDPNSGYCGAGACPARGRGCRESAPFAVSPAGRPTYVCTADG